MYVRKTEDNYDLYGMYDRSWEYLLTEEDTISGAKQTARAYVENEGISVTIKKVRVHK